MSNDRLTSSVNDARAMRVAEVMTDFRTIQHRLNALQANPSDREAQLPGYSALRQCKIEGQALLATPFQTLPPGGNGGSEQTRQQLQL